MSLNQRKSGKDATDEMDRLSFEIYDPKHPPKIPRGSWANDARNKRWLDLLPPEKPSASDAASTMLDAMKVYKEIRSDVRDEIGRPEEPQSRTSEVLETMRAAKDLFAPAAAQASSAPADPFDTAKKIMDMRGNDPMIAALMQRLDAADKAQEKAREREFELMKELRQQSAAPATPAKGIIEQLTELAAISDKLAPLKTLFGLGNGAMEAVRASKTTGLDLVKDLGTRLFESPIAEGLGQWLGSIAQRNAQGNPAPMNGQPQNGVQARPGNDLESFITNVLNPALLRHYIQGFSGTDFAGWLFDGYPDRVQQLQNFTHPRLPGLRGSSAIIAAYKHTESMWPTLSSRGEQEFTKFVTDFCEWKPDQGEPAVDAEVVESEKEEGPERI